MPAYPREYFTYFDRVDAGPGGGYDIGHTKLAGYSAYDSSNYETDNNLTQLGNIPDDRFLMQKIGGLFADVYVGSASGTPGIVMHFSGNPQLYLLTNQNYQVGDSFSYTSDPFTLVCFATGTTIKTARGEIAVENLREGEEVITAYGEARAIHWIGHRRTDCARHPRPKDVWPVLVEAGALGNATPARDLYLTPYHAVALTCGSEVLVPIRCLINGTTIRQMPVDEITYWHIELESHDIILANGAAAESYLDTGNRAGFENADGPVQLHPDFKPADDADFCRPLVTSGPILAALRASLPATDRARAA